MNYNSKFHYNSVKSHQLDQVWDPANGILTKFTYNTTGSVTKIDDSSQPVVQDFFWNEQQQLTGVSNQQGVHHYVYDHSGERIMKSSLINSTVYLNDQVIDSASNLDPYTVYLNPWYFEDKKVMEATRRLFKQKDITCIDLIHTPLN